MVKKKKVPGNIHTLESIKHISRHFKLTEPIMNRKKLLAYMQDHI